MSDKQMEICDYFVYIPQYSKKTASLNVLVAGSIVMHHFALFAGFEETAIVDAKFELEACRGKLERFQNPNDAEKDEIEKKREERRLKTMRLEEGVAGE